MGTAVGIITALGSVAALLVWFLRWYTAPEIRERKRKKIIRKVAEAIRDHDGRKMSKWMRKLHDAQ